MPDPTHIAASDARPALRRALGRWDLTAIGVNQVIGGAVFALPAAVAANTGTWSPWLVAATGGLSLLIALCFAEMASRFEGTGGPYLYTRAAFGRFAAFEVGWLMWFTRAARSFGPTSSRCRALTTGPSRRLRRSRNWIISWAGCSGRS